MQPRRLFAAAFVALGVAVPAAVAAETAQPPKPDAVTPTPQTQATEPASAATTPAQGSPAETSLQPNQPNASVSEPSTPTPVAPGQPAPGEKPEAQPSEPSKPAGIAPGQPAPPAVRPELPKPDQSTTAAKKGDRPIANTLPQPATTAEPKPLDIDPMRFGGKKPDLAYGAYQRGLYKTAYNLAIERANQGDAAAETLVAEILSRGLGMPVNGAEAAKWYQRAAEQGVSEAQFQYALILLDGRFAKKDDKEAQALLQASAETGNPLAQFNLAQLLVQREPGENGLAKAVPYYEKASDSGLADVQYAMAQIYANGAAGKKQDDAEARRLLVLAARQNYDTAQLDLGQWLVDGRGGKRDLKSGFNWMKRAAEGGNVAAQNRLAKLYEGGIGVDPDLVTAAAWYIVARRAGLIDQQMEDFMQGLDDDQTKQALQKANRLR